MRDIQPYVIQYASTIEQVTGIDVEIVDEELVRIAGTGMKNRDFSKSMASEGSIYRNVLKTGKSYYIDKPRMHELCKLCDKKESCKECSELNTPIIFEGRIIGVIGMITFTEHQKQRMALNLTSYRNFTKHIAEFISAKVLEHREAAEKEQMMALLNQVISHVEEGVLLLDNQGLVKDANMAAKSQLGTKDLTKVVVKIEDTGDMILDKTEYKLTIDNRERHVIGNYIPVESQLAGYSSILLFNDIKNVKSGIYNLTNLNSYHQVSQIVGKSLAIEHLKQQIIKIAASTSTVLITGESGTGKDLVARVIHSEGNRSNRPFVSINCGAIPDTLLESELFGYVKGAFTGADPRGKIGKFELANKGIIFLDEIGDMPLYLQVKLLRVLQDRKISRIGSNQIIDIDVRVIAATNRDLESLIRENKFRRDLYYRLNVIPLHVSALRERREDIPDLVSMLLKKYSGLFNRKISLIDAEAMKILLAYDWPGNVRELENTIEFMVNMSETEMLTKKCLPGNILTGNQEPVKDVRSVGTSNEVIPLKDLERQSILHALEICGDDMEGKQQAAKKLGIGIATLYRKLEKYN